MKTRLLFTGALVFLFSLLAVPSEAQISANVNEGGMRRIFQDLNVYPNPFDDKLIINYTLPEDTEVSIELYNSLGQKVKEYSQSAVSQWAGTHQIVLFRPEAGEAGVYFLRLTVPEFGSLTTRVMGK